MNRQLTLNEAIERAHPGDVIVVTQDGVVNPRARGDSDGDEIDTSNARYKHYERHRFLIGGDSRARV